MERGVTRPRVSAGYRWVACLVVLVLAFVSVNFSFAFTPDGVQCPTAAVQLITVATKSSGGKPSVCCRAPRPGDTGFVQCRCAEKRGAQQQAAVHQGGIRLVMIQSERLTVTVPPAERQVALHFPRASQRPTSAGAPATPPPIA